MATYTRLGPGGFPIAATAVVANAQVAGVVLSAIVTIAVAGSASANAAATGGVLSASSSILAGKASATSQIIIGGVSPPPPYWQLQRVDAKARGRILTVQCKLISGIASGTITTASLRLVGMAVGSAAVRADNVITLRHSIYGGIAIGEKYLTDEEQLILMLEAA